MNNGSFCRIYQPVPPEESSGEKTLENEMTYCVLCRPDCPDSIMEEWRKRGGD